MTPTEVRVGIEPWSDTDLDLLHHMNIPEMLDHLGGTEREEQLLSRHKRYLGLEEKGIGRMFRIVLLPEREAVGNIGYWERVWNEETVWEMGWGILPPYQGRGIATAAGAAAIAIAVEHPKVQVLHAFPSVDNPASNAICRKLGFSLAGECSFEYPPGTFMRCSDWRLDLRRES
ncbi:GNAT family N-acetyltransferase [Paenibacillus caseinilyticus]|uniref:N-acetyltransferase GCN5 n=1 Tax=Paenibacillus mucilaginosus K02 TaxID=997761 RepID=I0BBR7_9BACL|nr:GNAT family N-acetyltransferase [Paenibacillus mucilaginosus]AFH59814.1 N-acetyltransferase GCN5 [Paenibacillus mucilaginosus K02]